MNVNSKTPEIRFAGFEDEWVKKKYDDVFDLLSNNTLSRDALNSESGVAKNIHYGDVLTKFGEYIDVSSTKLPFISDPTVATKFIRYYLKDGDIVIADTAEDETVGKCTEVLGIGKTPIVAGLHTMPCRPKEKYAPKYMGYYLNSNAYHDKLLPLMQGVKVTSISRTGVKETEVIVSSEFDEQEKIGEHFASLDTMIALETSKHEKLVTVKKAMLERLFPKEGCAIPELRFDGYKGPWKKSKLADIANRIVRKNVNNESSLPLTISAIYGLVDQFTYFNNRIASGDISNYYLVTKGEFAYNKSSSSGFPFGVTKRLDYYEKGVLSTLYIVFSIKNHAKTNSDFLASYFDTDRWHKGVAEVASEGARNHGLLNITADDFLNINLYIPEKECEQALIGTFFRNLDTQIALQKQKVQKLKNIKSACMEKMFV